MNRLLAGVALAILAVCGPASAEDFRPERPAASGKPALPPAPPPPPLPEDACTADVKQCPDGRFVSRDPARGCAFSSCPDAGHR